MFIKALEMAEKTIVRNDRKRFDDLRAFVFEPTGPVSIERSVVVWVDCAW